MKKPLIGYDVYGQVYDTGSNILREIRNDYKENVKKLFEAYENFNLVGKNIIETKIKDDGNLEHRKLITTYPHEWTPNMFKDALLFHLNLVIDLDSLGISLKDALPSNILFNGTSPYFIDFLSLVFTEKLKEQEWLSPCSTKEAYYRIVNEMLLPHFVIPFFAMHLGTYDNAKTLLSGHACNCKTPIPNWYMIFSGYKKLDGISSKLPKAIFTALRLNVYKILLKYKVIEFNTFASKLKYLIERTDVTPPLSGYASYYSNKGENIKTDMPEMVSTKQQTVKTIMRQVNCKTVLDLGANTGWFSVLAQEENSYVIAMEKDVFCIDLLYLQAKKFNLNILPLCITFKELTNITFGEDYKNDAYQGRDFSGIPLYNSALERLGCELVLVLALSHHLILDEGISISELFSILANLTKKTLIIEFINLEDEKIVNAPPSFFKKLASHNSSSYNMELFLLEGGKYFNTVSIHDSDSETRKILVFNKR